MNIVGTCKYDSVSRVLGGRSPASLTHENRKLGRYLVGAPRSSHVRMHKYNAGPLAGTGETKFGA